jgi:hypothetical protein
VWSRIDLQNERCFNPPIQKNKSNRYRSSEDRRSRRNWLLQQVPQDNVQDFPLALGVCSILISAIFLVGLRWLFYWILSVDSGAGEFMGLM